MKINDNTLKVIANFGYYDDQYPHILSCKRDMFAGQINEYLTKERLLPLAQTSGVGLYIHIPFCKTQCLYCDCTVKLERRENEFVRYIDHLEKQAYAQFAAYGSRIPVETLYIGGGTPSILPEFLIERLFIFLEKYYDFGLCVQKTFEASPYTLTETKIHLLKLYGINRLTFGVQTLEQSVLDMYNRPQLQDETLRIILKAKQSGIPFINIDIVAGMPGQTLAGFIYTMRVISEYIQPTSMVVHPFQPTLRTPFSRMKKEYAPKDIKLRNIMRKIGIKFTEAIEKQDTYNVAKNQQLYDVSYAYKSVIGLGYGAITSIPGSLKCYWESLEDYYSYFSGDSSVRVSGIRLEYKDIIDAYIIRSLSSNGVSRDVFFNLFGIQVEKTDFFRIIQLDSMSSMFIDTDTIRFSDQISRIEKTKFFLSSMNGYPISSHIVDTYASSGYSDLNIFFDY